MNAGPEAVINLPLTAEATSLMRPGWSYSVGIHPWDTATATEADFNTLSVLAQHPQIVAIGECGLDALKGAPLDVQEQIFLRHVQLSEELQKPLIIHAVRTHSRLIQLRNALRPTQRWMIHGFRGKPQQAEQLIRAGFDISLGKTYNPAVLDVIPPDRLHFETDDQ